MRLIYVFTASIFLCLVVLTSAICAQETNPVDRKVTNLNTDTPSLNPITTERKRQSANKSRVPVQRIGGDGDLVVDSDKSSASGIEGKRIVIYEGDVDVHFGIYRLQADKITIYQETNIIIAEGSVVFDQGADQRITGTTGTWNYKTKLGDFVNSTGYTNQTNDGDVLYFKGDRVERTKLDEVVVTNGEFTACEDAVPKWSFTSDKAVIITDDRVKLKSPAFRIKGIPIIKLPFLSIPIDKKDRSSGFLTPTVGYSEDKGFRISNAYFQTLGRSADATIRLDVFTERGIGYGVDFRTRANSRSFLNLGFYGVQDRILGASVSSQNRDQGGTSIYVDGVHYFPNGFVGVANFKLTSSLAFRQRFSEGIQQIISPIEISEAFVNKSWDDYTLHILGRSQVISIPNVLIKTRNLPSIDFEKRPSLLKFFDKAYFSFKTTLEGISRREEVTNLVLYRNLVGSDPVVAPAVGQRLDAHPQLTIPFDTKYFSLTATAGGRVTYYSNSFNDLREVVGNDVIRKYGEFELDFRPAALARNFYGKEDVFRFRHVIEPYLKYKYVKGINNFKQIIRFDYPDTQSDTNEIEFGIINRIFTRRYPKGITKETRRLIAKNSAEDNDSLSIQPYEIFTLAVRGKYFFDPTFGGALIPGQRNQITPITELSYYTFGGVARRFSPLNIDATYRPRGAIFVNTKLNLGVHGDGLRNLSTTIGYRKKLYRFFQTFYYTRAVNLTSSLAQYSDPFGKEAGTSRGSQWSPSIFLGDRNKGFFGGTSHFFDFQNRRATKEAPLVRSVYTLGYAYDCCSATMQYYTLNVGIRQETRYVFSFKLNGIGTFGTEQFGQFGF